MPFCFSCIEFPWGQLISRAQELVTVHDFLSSAILELLCIYMRNRACGQLIKRLRVHDLIHLALPSCFWLGQNGILTVGMCFLEWIFFFCMSEIQSGVSTKEDMGTKRYWVQTPRLSPVLCHQEHRTRKHQIKRNLHVHLSGKGLKCDIICGNNTRCPYQVVLIWRGWNLFYKHGKNIPFHSQSNNVNFVSHHKEK